jgi:hypothetical protein
MVLRCFVLEPSSLNGNRSLALQVDKIRFLRKFQMPNRVRAGCCLSYQYAQSSSIYENAVGLKVIPFVSC